MPKLFKEDNGIYYIDYRVGGRRHRHSLHTDNKELAKTIFEDLLTRHTLGILGIAPLKNPLLTDLFNEYLLYCKANRSPRTYRDTKLHVDKFLSPVFCNVRVNDLTEKHVEDLISQMRGRTVKDDAGKEIAAPYHVRTINLRLETLRKILRRAVSVKDIERLPFNIKLLPCQRSLPKYVTPEQFKKWLKELDSNHRKRATLSANTGISDGDLATLLWEDYDPKLSLLRLRRPKTGRTIAIPLNFMAMSTIKALRKQADGPYIFSGVKSVKRAYRTASKNSGVNITPHMLRHTFATELLSKGAPLAHIQALLGHADQKTTEIYARVIPEYLRATVAKLDKQKVNNGRKKGGGNEMRVKKGQ